MVLSFSEKRRHCLNDGSGHLLCDPMIPPALEIWALRLRFDEWGQHHTAGLISSCMTQFGWFTQLLTYLFHWDNPDPFLFWLMQYLESAGSFLWLFRTNIREHDSSWRQVLGSFTEMGSKQNSAREPQKQISGPFGCRSWVEVSQAEESGLGVCLRKKWELEEKMAKKSVGRIPLCMTWNSLL